MKLTERELDELERSRKRADSQFHDVPRGKLAALFDRVRRDLADRVPPEEIERRIADGYNMPDTCLAIAPLQRCEHHPYQDNCSICAPRWGHVGAFVRAR